MITTGIDVSAASLSVVVNRKGKADPVMAFDNDIEGHQRLIKALRKRKVQRIVLEATGIYHLDLSIALHDSGHFELMVLNPRAAKHYAELRMARNKTDPRDAKLLAEFAQTMPFEAWRRPASAYLAIRACARRLNALSQQRTRTKNQLHALESSQETPTFVIDDVKFSLEQVRLQIDRLRDKAMELIMADAELKQRCDWLLSVRGIGQASAIALLGELLVLPDDMKAKQWVAMAGLDPRAHQSGTSVNKRTRITKAGNPYLRVALFMPALVAVRHEPRVKAYYNHLVQDQGLKKMQAICAVMRKLLHAIHGMFAAQQSFDAERFYRGPLLEA